MNDDHAAFCADTKITSNPNWTQLPGGTFTNISVNNDGSLFAISTDAGKIYYAPSFKAPKWVVIPGAMVKITRNGSVICGVNGGNTLYCADTNITKSPNWTALSGQFKNVSINKDGSLFAVSTDGKVMYTPSYKTPKWVQVPGSFTQLST